MKVLFRTSVLAVTLALAPGLLAAEEVAAEAAAAGEAEAAQMVEVDVTAGQVVKVNTGSEMVDGAANLALRCTEKKVAMEACGGGFKGIACKKGLEMTKYKGLECPNI